MTAPAVPGGRPPWDGLHSWRDARRSAEQSGWTLIGTGDWAWVYAAPGGELAWRITPFDPAFDYFATVCEENPHQHLPHVVARSDHPGGGASVLMELLDEVPQPIAADWAATFDSEPDPSTHDMLLILREAVQTSTMPLFMGLDTNPGNVRRRRQCGDLVLIDAFWMNGIELFEMVVTAPEQAVALFGRSDLIHWSHIPAMDPAETERLLRALESP